jgi:hypothetical protein
VTEQEHDESVMKGFLDWVRKLETNLASTQSTCTKLHDLNHMQAQRIEALEQERVSLCEGNKRLAGRVKELEQQLIDAGLDRR